MDLDEDPKKAKRGHEFKVMCHPKVFVCLLGAVQIILALYCLMAVSDNSILATFPFPSFDAQPLFGPDYVIGNGTTAKPPRSRRIDPAPMTYLLQTKRYMLFGAAWLFLIGAILSNIAVRWPKALNKGKRRTVVPLLGLLPSVVATFICLYPMVIQYIRTWRKFVYELCTSPRGCDSWTFYAELFAFVVLPGCVFLAAYLYILYGFICTMYYITTNKFDEKDAELMAPPASKRGATVSRSWSKRVAAAEVNRELKTALDNSRANSHTESPGSLDDRRYVHMKDHMSMTELNALNHSGTIPRVAYDFREPSNSRFQPTFSAQSMTMASPYQRSIRQYPPQVHRFGYGLSAGLGFPFYNEDSYSQL